MRHTGIIGVIVITDMKVKTLCVFSCSELCKVKQSQLGKQVAGQMPNVLGGSQLHNMFPVST